MKPTEHGAFAQSCNGQEGLPIKLSALSLAQAHSAKSGQDLTAYEKFPEMRTVEATVVAPNKQLIGKTFKRDARAVQACQPPRVSALNATSLPQAAPIYFLGLVQGGRGGWGCYPSICVLPPKDCAGGGGHGALAGAAIMGVLQRAEAARVPCPGAAHSGASM